MIKITSFFFNQQGNLKPEDLEGMMLIAEEYMMEHIQKQLKKALMERIPTLPYTHHWKKFLQIALKFSLDDVIDHWVSKFEGEKWKIDHLIPYEMNVRFLAKAILNASRGDNPQVLRKMCYDLSNYKNPDNCLP